ncbi:MAG: ferrous iron transport protein A [Phycisphaerae bacterium]
MEPTDRGGQTATPNQKLSDIAQGQEVILVGLDGGSQFVHRMAELGLTPGVRFRVIRRARLGPFIISIKDTRLMLGHGMTRKVLVRRV